MQTEVSYHYFDTLYFPNGLNQPIEYTDLSFAILVSAKAAGKMRVDPLSLLLGCAYFLPEPGQHNYFCIFTTIGR
jgi:hypothetical protein